MRHGLGTDAAICISDFLPFCQTLLLFFLLYRYTMRSLYISALNYETSVSDCINGPNFLLGNKIFGFDFTVAHQENRTCPNPIFLVLLCNHVFVMSKIYNNNGCILFPFYQWHKILKMLQKLSKSSFFSAANLRLVSKKSVTELKHFKSQYAKYLPHRVTASH